MEDSFGILYPYYQVILGEVETRIYWFVNFTEAQMEFERVSKTYPQSPFYLIQKSGETITILKINGPIHYYEGTNYQYRGLYAQR